MIVYATFHGGANYSPETTATEFPSLSAALEEYRNRYRDSYYPCWGDEGWGERNEDGRRYVGFGFLTVPNGAFADVHGPLDTHDVYPDMILTEGPRGGLRWERA